MEASSQLHALTALHPGKAPLVPNICKRKYFEGGHINVVTMCKTTQCWADSEKYINPHVEHVLLHLILSYIYAQSLMTVILHSRLWNYFLKFQCRWLLVICKHTTIHPYGLKELCSYGNIHSWHLALHQLRTYLFCLQITPYTRNKLLINSEITTYYLLCIWNSWSMTDSSAVAGSACTAARPSVYKNAFSCSET
jgi:hypothetical protein